MLAASAVGQIALDFDAPTARSLGFDTGSKFSSLVLSEQEQQNNDISSALSAAKFFATHVWTAAFSKRVDKLRADDAENANVFVFLDSDMPWLVNLSCEDAEREREVVGKIVAWLEGFCEGGVKALGFPDEARCVASIKGCAFSVTVSR